MAKTNTVKTGEQNRLFYVNVPKNKISFELRIYDKIKGKSREVYATGNTPNIDKLIKAIADSKYKSVSIKEIKTKDLGKAEILTDFTWGTKGDVKNYNVSLGKIRFKWHSPKNPDKENVTEMYFPVVKDEEGMVHWGEDYLIENAILKKLNDLINVLSQKEKDATIGIKFVENKEGEKRAYIAFIGEAKTPQKEVEKKKESKEKGKEEVSEIKTDNPLKKIEESLNKLPEELRKKALETIEKTIEEFTKSVEKEKEKKTFKKAPEEKEKKTFKKAPEEKEKKTFKKAPEKPSPANEEIDF